MQNAKRRVYDALNVLIASDVLAKHGKLVSISPRKESCSPAKESSNVIAKLKEEILEKGAILKLKNQKLSELYNKYFAAINLQKRNMVESTSSPKLRFPFVFLNFPQGSKLQISSGVACTKIQLDRAFQVWGDIDMALKLGLN